jgi:hypothetical protein
MASSPSPSGRPVTARHPAVLREEARRRLVTRVLIGAGALVFVVLLGLFVSRQVVLASPKHALVSIESAFQDHDGTRLAYYADVDAIVAQVADQGVDWLILQHRHELLAALRAEAGDIGTAPDSAQQVQLLKFALTDRGGKVVASALAAGTDSATLAPRLTEAFQSVPPLDLLMGGDHLDYVATGRPQRVGDGSVIPVTLEYRELGTDITVRLVLSHQEKRWKVVGLQGFDETMSAIDNAQLARLSETNRPIQARIEGMLELGTPKVTLLPVGRTDLAEQLMVPVHNTSPFVVRQVTLLFGTRGGDEEHTEHLVKPVSIGPGATVALTWAFPETVRGTSRSAWLASRQAHMTLVPRGVVFDSAGVVDTLRLYGSYAEITP